MSRHLHVVDGGAHTTIGGSSSLLMPTGGGGVAAFDPLTLSPAGWWDFSDAASVTLNVSAVSQINDKSGNSRHAVQAVGVSQPAYVLAGQNGLNHATFNNHRVAATSLALSQSLTVVVVFARVSNTAAHAFLTSSGVAAGPLFENGSAYSAYNGVFLSSGVTVDASWHVLTATFNGASSILRLDGAQIASGSLNVTAFSGAFTIGDNGGGSQYSNAKIGEVLTCATPTTVLRNAYEASLKTKWGTP